jgi:hypothetical protein
MLASQLTRASRALNTVNQIMLYQYFAGYRAHVNLALSYPLAVTLDLKGNAFFGALVNR